MLKVFWGHDSNKLLSDFYLNIIGSAPPSTTLIQQDS